MKILHLSTCWYQILLKYKSLFQIRLMWCTSAPFCLQRLLAKQLTSPYQIDCWIMPGEYSWLQCLFLYCGKPNERPWAKMLNMFAVGERICPNMYCTLFGVIWISFQVVNTLLDNSHIDLLKLRYHNICMRLKLNAFPSPLHVEEHLHGQCWN